MIFNYFKNRRRQKIKSQIFPQEWEEILKNKVPYYLLLPFEDQKELKGDILIFLNEKNFIGCDDLKITDEIRLIVAAQACILLLHRKTNYYPDLKTILIYPQPFVVKATHELGGGAVLEDNEVRSGESWHRGMVILAWDEIELGARSIHDGQNLVFHEFAHQLDHEDGASNGVPVLKNFSAYRTWGQIFGKEFEQLIEDEKNNIKTVMDTYGATNPAEFFAVATETFFENPEQLYKKHPELYQELAKFYCQDPRVLFERKK